MDYWRGNPVQAIKDWFGVTPDDWQGESLQGLLGTNAQWDRHAIKSAHGPGKTAFMAWAGWFFLNCYEDSRVVSTAPTLHQLSDILWAEYAKWYAKMPNGLQERWSISGTHIRSRVEGKDKLWFAVARTSNKPANLQGFHNSNLFIQCDEASGVPQDVFEVIEGAMSEAGEEGKVAKLLLAGNPNFTTGELYDAFNRNAEQYERFTITGDPLLLDSLLIEQGAEARGHGKVYFSPRIKPQYRRTIGEKYGIGSAVYDVRVRGVFPRHDDNVIIPFEWAERAQGQPLPLFDKIADPVTIVIDPARQGGNETVVGSFRRGILCAPFRARAKTRLQETADMVEEEIRMWQAEGVSLLEVIVDEPGVGGDTADELERRGWPVKRYHGGKPLDPQRDPPDECRMFANRRARDWWHVRRLLEQNKIPLPMDEVLVGQLSTPQYKYSEQQKIVVESKEKIKDRLGSDASPDRADVIVMGSAPWNSMADANTGLTPADVLYGNDRPQIEEWA